MRQPAIFAITVGRGVPQSNFSRRKITLRYAATPLQSKDQEGADDVDVSAKLRSVGRKDDYLEQIVTRLSLEADVTSISWHVISMIDTEEAEATSDAGTHA
jgi:hypothetical protein